MAYRYQDMIDVFQEKYPDRKLSNEEIITYVKGKNPGITILPPEAPPEPVAPPQNIAQQAIGKAQDFLQSPTVAQAREGAGTLLEQQQKLLPQNIMPEIAKDPKRALKVAGQVGLYGAQAAAQTLPFTSGAYGALRSLPILLRGANKILPMAASALGTGATQYGIERLKGKEHTEAQKIAKSAAGTDALITGAIKGIPAVLRGIIRGTGQALVGIPEAQLKKVIGKLEKGEEVLGLPLGGGTTKKGFIGGEFKGRETFENLTEKVGKLLDKTRRERGKDVGKFIPMLEKSDVVIDPHIINKKLEKIVPKYQYAGDWGAVDPKTVNQFTELVIKNQRARDLGGLQKLKETAQAMAKGSYRTEGAVADVPSKKGSELLREVARLAKEEIEKYAPTAFKKEMIQANKKFSDFANIDDVLREKFGKEPSIKHLTQLTEQLGVEAPRTVPIVRKALKDLDKLAKPSDKFMKETKEALTQVAFNKITPMHRSTFYRALTYLFANPKIIREGLKATTHFTKSKPLTEPLFRQLLKEDSK